MEEQAEGRAGDLQAMVGMRVLTTPSIQASLIPRNSSRHLDTYNLTLVCTETIR